MRVVIDIEANGLKNPDQIWLVVAKDIDTGKYYIFRNVTTNQYAKEEFYEFAKNVEMWIGHHIIGYDVPVIRSLLCGGSFTGDTFDPSRCLDTLIVSKLVEYSRQEGHSVEDYGTEFGLEKKTFFKFTDKELFNCNSILFKQMEDYCIRDVDIAEKIYLKYKDWLEKYPEAIKTEQEFQLVVNGLEDKGFFFDTKKAERLLGSVAHDLANLDTEIQTAFPPKEVLVREFTPKLTKFGTISKTSVPRLLHEHISDYVAGETYRQTKQVDFNPASHKQVLEVLTEAGWSPTDKTQTHIDTEREVNSFKRKKSEGNPVDLEILRARLEQLQKTGWKINENNLSSLPASAPEPARLLAKRILLESRRRTLTEWLSLVQDEGRIHGRFYGIGAWTQRMSHQSPNTANIPSALKQDGTPKLLGADMRSLWRAPPKRLLVGVDAEGIQLRIFAHYINDEEFTDALVRGRKEDKTDPHNLNKRILGSTCKSRDAAKRFIFALLLGAGTGKLSQILDCTKSECEQALDNLVERYKGFAKIKKEIVPTDARNGYFIGLDNRKVLIPGSDLGERRHLCMSGYLQNGEAIVIKRTANMAAPLLRSEEFLVNIVHDEFVIEVANDVRRAEEVKEIFCSSIEQVGKDLQLRCPLKGDGSVGLTWMDIH